MSKPIFPPPNTMLARFLDAMLTVTMHLHPEFIQETGNWRLATAAEELKEMGWPVEMIELHSPTEENPHRCVALYFIGEHTMHAAFGGNY